MDCLFCSNKCGNGAYQANPINACVACYNRIGGKTLDWIVNQIGERDNHGQLKSVYERSRIVSAAVERYRYRGKGHG